MSERIEFLSSKEFWEVQIATTLWNSKKITFVKCEKLAKTIVNDQFMSHIKELSNQSK